MNEELEINGTKVTDLSPLKGMGLKSLNLDDRMITADLSPLKGLPLEKINGKPAAEFWKEF